MNILRLRKIIGVCLLIMMIISTINTIVLATTQPKDITADGANANITTDTIDRTGKNLITILQAVGVVLSVVILIVIGIKYMMGSAEEKAEYKKTLMPYVIGAALIFAAAMFAQVLYDFFNNWTGGSNVNPNHETLSEWND